MAISRANVAILAYTWYSKVDSGLLTFIADHPSALVDAAISQARRASNSCDRFRMEKNRKKPRR